MAQLLDEHASAALAAGDFSVREVSAAAGQWDFADQEKGRQIFDRMSQLVRTLPQISSVSLLDMSGNVLLENRAFPRRSKGNFSHRDYYQQAYRDPGGLYIGPMEPDTTTGERRFTISRAVVKPDGRFAGVVAAGIFSQYFSDIFKDVRAGVTAVLSKEDGGLLAGWPLNAKARAASESQLTSIRALSKYPVTVSVWLPYKLALAPWWNRLITYSAGTLAALAAFAVLTCFGLRTAESDRRARSDLRAAKETLDRKVEAQTVELRQSEARLRHAAEAAGLTFIVADFAADQVLTAANYANVMGFEIASGTDCATAYFKLMDHIARENRPEVKTLRTALMRGQEGSGTTEFEVIGDDGTSRWIASHWTAEQDGKGSSLRLMVIHLDVTERKAREDQILLLMREVNHRSKNLLTVVQSIVTQSARYSSPQTFVRDLSQRLQGFAASQDLIVDGNRHSVPLIELINSQLRPCGDALSARIELDGEPLVVTPSAAQGIGMALYELATNALKYGALSQEESGRVKVRWRRKPNGGQRLFVMSWTEEGGPPVETPTRQGFRSLIIERMSAQSVGGTATFDYNPAGIRWTLTAPESNVVSFKPYSHARGSDQAGDASMQ